MKFLSKRTHFKVKNKDKNFSFSDDILAHVEKYKCSALSPEFWTEPGSGSFPQVWTQSFIQSEPKEDLLTACVPPVCPSADRSV